jgi:SpoIID/LytB domain protein
VSCTRRHVLALALLWGSLGSGFRVQGSQNVFQDPMPDSRSVRVGFLKPDGGYSVTTMPLETYVSRVLAGEAMRDSQPAALEALAITVRTFALANLNRHGADGFDLCDQTHCQVVRPATAATERAARATARRVLLRNGVTASVYYTASCGGRSEIPSDVWPGAEDPPFLPSREDDACEGAPAWAASLGESDLLRALRSGGFRGDRLRDVRIASRNASGRVAQLTLEGLQPGLISGQDLRVVVGRTLGWQHIKSTAFELRRQGDSYRFSGRGSGHGVGMCVIGSAKMAERGTTADAILARYFPGLEISGPSSGASVAGGRSASGTEVSAKRVPSGSDPVGTKAVPFRTDVLVSLPDGDEGERMAIVRTATRARDELARALGVSPPSRVTLRFHPTTDAYEKATRQPWYTSGTVVRGDVHVLPLATLRDRGVLDRTIRHELVHLMTDVALAKRPAWVREGAAIFYAEDPPPGSAAERPLFKPEPRASCPQDNELLHPVSVGALTNAYARARACFAKQIAAGRSWRDVR